MSYIMLGLSCLYEYDDKDIEYLTEECNTWANAIDALGPYTCSVQEAMERAVSRGLINLRWLTDVTYCDPLYTRPDCGCENMHHSTSCMMMRNRGWQLHPRWVRTASPGWIPAFLQLCESARDFEAGEEIIKSLYTPKSITYSFPDQRIICSKAGKCIEHLFPNGTDIAYYGSEKRETPRQTMLQRLAQAAERGVYLEDEDQGHILLQAVTTRPQLRKMLHYPMNTTVA